MKQIHKTREELQAEGYRYSGAATCRGCGVAIHWFETPKGKRVKFQKVKDMPAKLEPHWPNCPEAKEFRKPSMGKTPKPPKKRG